MTEFVSNRREPCADIRYDALPLTVAFTDEELGTVLEAAMRDPARNPIEEADAFRDTPPEDEADELQLAKGEIAWLREAVRRLKKSASGMPSHLVSMSGGGL